MTGKVIGACGMAGLLLWASACMLMAQPWAPPAQDSPASRIVVYRPGNLTGFAKQFMLRLNDQRQAAMANGQYFVMDRAPGTHVLALEDTDARQALQSRPAQAHYYRLQVIRQKDSLGARLEAVPAEQAQRELAELKPAQAYVAPEQDGFHTLPAETGPRT